MLSEKADSLRVGFHTALSRYCTHKRFEHLSTRLYRGFYFAAQHVR